MSHIQPDTTLPKTPKIKVYSALIAQAGTAAPTITELQNTLGDTVVWTRDGVGEYTGTLAGAFTENKTWAVLMHSNYSNAYASIARSTTNTVHISTGTTTTPADAILVGNSIEIKVYE